jgi:hypothetical protein
LPATEGPREASQLSIGGDASVVGRGEALTILGLPAGRRIASTPFAGVDFDVASETSHAVALSRDGAFVAHGGLSRITVRRVPSLEPVHAETDGHRMPPTQIMWSDDGKFFASLDTHALCTWQREGTPLRWCRTLNPSGARAEAPLAMWWSDTNGRVDVVSRSWIASFDARTGDRVEHTTHSPLSRHGVAGPFVVLGLAHGRGWVEQAAAGREVTFHLRGTAPQDVDISTAGDDAQLRCAAVSADGRTRAIGLGEHGVWITTGASAPRRLATRADLCALTDDGAWLVVADRHGHGPIQWWDVARGERVRSLGTSPERDERLARSALALTPNADWIVAAHDAPLGRGLRRQSPVQGWTPKTGERFELRFRDAASSLAMSTDGRWLAMGTSDARVHLVDLHARQR